MLVDLVLKLLYNKPIILRSIVGCSSGEGAHTSDWGPSISLI
jgi:hypothetical protein